MLNTPWFLLCFNAAASSFICVCWAVVLLCWCCVLKVLEQTGFYQCNFPNTWNRPEWPCLCLEHSAWMWRIPGTTATSANCWDSSTRRTFPTPSAWPTGCTGTSPTSLIRFVGQRETVEFVQTVSSKKLELCCRFQTFLGSTGKHYRAELEPVDFRTAAEASRININSWVEKQTQGGWGLGGFLPCWHPNITLQVENTGLERKRIHFILQVKLRTCWSRESWPVTPDWCWSMPSTSRANGRSSSRRTTPNKHNFAWTRWPSPAARSRTMQTTIHTIFTSGFSSSYLPCKF